MTYLVPHDEADSLILPEEVYLRLGLVHVPGGVRDPHSEVEVPFHPPLRVKVERDLPGLGVNQKGGPPDALQSFRSLRGDDLPVQRVGEYRVLALVVVGGRQLHEGVAETDTPIVRGDAAGEDWADESRGAVVHVSHAHPDQEEAVVGGVEGANLGRRWGEALFGGPEKR